MEMMGKRLPYLAKYKAGADGSGKLSGVSLRIYCDSGFSYNESTADGAASRAKNCYIAKSWNIIPSAVLTNTPSNTYVRAPGSTQGHAIMENVMEHIAVEAGMDPLELRLKNMVPDPDHPLREIISELQESSDYQARKVEVANYNEENMWKKKGISIVPIKYRCARWWLLSCRCRWN